jgi:hypothetical protein
MSVLDDGAAYFKMLLGLKVSRAAATLPATAQTPYFTVAGGKVLLTGLIGIVTTIVQAQATTVQLIATPTVGTAVNLSNATGDVNGKEVGATICLATTLGGTLVVGNAGANAFPIGNYFVVQTGTIDFKTGATSTGATKWILSYIPLDAGATVVAA